MKLITRWCADLYSTALLNESMAGYDPHDKRKPTRLGFVLMTLASMMKLKWINFACYHFGHKVEVESVNVDNDGIGIWNCTRCGAGGFHIWR